MTLEGELRNGVVVLETNESLPPDGTRVQVQVVGNGHPTLPRTESGTLRELLLEHAGICSSLPSDLAEQHDHYLYGTPKK